VRITADCPLIDPSTIDNAVKRLVYQDADYSTNILERTFLHGLDVEGFSFKSFERAYGEANEPHHCEHVTPYYHERDDFFEHVSVTSEEVFDASWIKKTTLIRNDEYFFVDGVRNWFQDGQQRKCQRSLSA
jgi:spore coat polysaccharide biosynthesis protein SpsF